MMKQKQIPEQQTVTTTEQTTIDIFISYSWADKEKVFNIKSNLEKEISATFWLDINAMGAGDALYSKIDSGIRECKIFLPCLSSSYVNSINCQREINLASDLKKQIIPLIVDDLSSCGGWPPKIIGPLVAGKLYVNLANESSNSNISELAKSLKEKIANQ